MTILYQKPMELKELISRVKKDKELYNQNFLTKTLNMSKNDQEKTSYLNTKRKMVQRKTRE